MNTLRTVLILAGRHIGLNATIDSNKILRKIKRKEESYSKGYAFREMEHMHKTSLLTKTCQLDMSSDVGQFR